MSVLHETFRVLRLPIAAELIEKYSDHPKCLNEDCILPILSNQKMNGYLKEIGDLCNISKEINFHMARHTFATSVTLINEVPIEICSGRSSFIEFTLLIGLMRSIVLN